MYKRKAILSESSKNNLIKAISEVQTILEQNNSGATTSKTPINPKELMRKTEILQKEIKIAMDEFYKNQTDTTDLIIPDINYCPPQIIMEVDFNNDTETLIQKANDLCEKSIRILEQRQK